MAGRANQRQNGHSKSQQQLRVSRPPVARRARHQGNCGMTMSMRLTAAQATVRYLASLNVRQGSEEAPLFGGVFAIFGHGNVAGLGEALYQYRDELPTYRAHNEQAMAHTAIAY